MNKDLFKNGIRDGIPICLGYFSVSIAFGISTVGQGLKIWQALLISMFNETSAGQLAAVPIIAASGSLIELISCQFIINLRYTLMSISLSQKLDSTMGTLQRAIFGFSVTDEIFAVAVKAAQGSSVGKSYLYGLMLTPWLGWSLGTLVGAVAGDILPPVVASSLGIAIYGMFIAIVIPEARKYKPVLRMCIIAVGLSLLFHFAPVLSSISEGFIIIICSVIAAGIMSFVHPLKVGDEDE